MTDIPSNLMQKGHTTGVVPYSRKKNVNLIQIYKSNSYQNRDLNLLIFTT